jgi:hypothetical protein
MLGQPGPSGKSALPRDSRLCVGQAEAVRPHSLWRKGCCFRQVFDQGVRRFVIALADLRQ